MFRLFLNYFRMFSIFLFFVSVLFSSLISLFGSIFSCLFVFLISFPSAIFFFFFKKKSSYFFLYFLNFFFLAFFVFLLFLSFLSSFFGFSLFFCFFFFVFFRGLQLFFKNMEISLPCSLVEKYVFANFLYGSFVNVFETFF